MSTNYSFTNAAQEATQLCKLMAGREKLTTDDLSGKILTVTAFDFAPKYDNNGQPVIDDNTGEIDTYGVITFAEYPDSYYCVGVAFTKVCKVWAAEFNGDVETASKELEASGGVRVEFVPGKTRKGNNIVNVKIIG